MNPWKSAVDEDTERAALEGRRGVRGLVERYGWADDATLYLPDPASSPSALVDLQGVMARKMEMTEKLRQLEQLERMITTATVLGPQQLAQRRRMVAMLREELQRFVAMQGAIMRTLQRSISTESLEIELDQQRTFVDLFLKLGEELPRLASVLAPPTTSTTSTAVQQTSMPDEVRQRVAAYDEMLAQLKATIAQLYSTQDDLQRLRGVCKQDANTGSRTAA